MQQVLATVVPFPVRSLSDLDQLDDTGAMRGYLDALNGRNRLERGRAYAHGFRNGLVDAGRAAKTSDQAKLAREWLARERRQ